MHLITTTFTNVEKSSLKGYFNHGERW